MTLTAWLQRAPLRGYFALAFGFTTPIPMIVDASTTLDKSLSGCARAGSRNVPSAA